MTAYIERVIAVVFCAALLCSILPKERAGKITSFAVGMVVLTVIVLPLIGLLRGSYPSLPKPDVQSLQIGGTSYLMDEFEKTVANDVAQVLQQKTGKSFRVFVEGACDTNGEIIGIARAEIAPYTTEYARITAIELGIAQSKVEEMQ